MLARDAKIYKDTYTLACTLFNMTRKFRGDLRATLAKRIEDTVLDIADIIVEANLAQTADERVRLLSGGFCVSYERLQFLINIAVEQKQISFRQHANISRMMDEIGRQATGWRKSAARH